MAMCLERVRQQYEQAAAECARLHAGGEPRATQLVGQPGSARTGDRSPGVDGRESEAVQAEAEKLKGEVDAAAARLAVERSRSQELGRQVDEFEQELERAKEALEVERERSAALEAHASDLQAQLQQLAGEGARTSEDSAEDWRKRVVQLQLDLRRALSDKAQLREEMGDLLRFLEELNDVLVAPVTNPS